LKVIKTEEEDTEWDDIEL